MYEKRLVRGAAGVMAALMLFGAAGCGDKAGTEIRTGDDVPAQDVVQDEQIEQAEMVVDNEAEDDALAESEESQVEEESEPLTEAETEESQDEAETEVENEVETEETQTEAEPESQPESETDAIVVEPVENLQEDFFLGVDASSVLVEENSGVKYYDFDGNEADPFKTMAEAGVNYIRLRVWNDPYDENGNGYGGGNNDLQTAITLGKRATDDGMKVFVDFHYSDFWADPKRQLVPKAWDGMDINEKSDALYEFTLDSMKQLLDAGVDVGMVQIGNEINYGMSGEKIANNIIKLLSSGSRAVRGISETYSKDIKIVVHYTNIDKLQEVDQKANMLELGHVDYDIMGLSYYPFWNGGFENIQKVTSHIMSEYGKDVIIAETSYCYTSRDGDGSGNSVSGKGDIVVGYPASVQGQASMLRDVIDAANTAGAKGVFYWEATWIPVGPATADNSAIWEEYGSGWASSYAKDYDPDDAGKYYGGCSWDNQALFDFDGYPLESLKTFQYVRTGS